MISVNHRVSVRALAEFALEGGDLIKGAGAVSRMLDGLRGHQMLQARYGAERASEVPVMLACVIDGIELAVYGRVDGVWDEESAAVIEEIKTTERNVTEIGADDYPVHWAQAQIYAHIIAKTRGYEQVIIKLAYVNLNGSQTTFSRGYDDAALEALFTQYARPYAQWVSLVDEWLDRSRPTFKASAFLYAEYRSGQREMAGQADVGFRGGKKLIVEAPTGIGKTAALLFPAIKAMGEGVIDRVFYLTARTTGQRAAEDAMARMSRGGLRARAVTLTAREKICPMERMECDPAFCPNSRGYYDRRRGALIEALSFTDYTQPEVESLARKHRLCPFELSLDLSEIADVVICDYNYAFDPRVRLKRFFYNKTRAALLIDEAHNLPGRVREMLDTGINERAFRALRLKIGKTEGRKHPLYKCLSDLLDAFKAVRTTMEGEENRREPPYGLTESSRVFAAISGEYLRKPFDWLGELYDRYYEALNFALCAESFTDDFRALFIPESKSSVLVRLWCADPSAYIADCMKRVRASIMFSATLSPMSFYADIMGVGRDEDGAMIQLPSPFPPENLMIVRASIPTRYSQRAFSTGAVARMIAAVTHSKTGNYLICFPSHAYLRQVLDAFLPISGGARVIAQRPSMNTAERSAFIDEFKPNPSASMAAFVVMGGVFSEGIDMAGERLSGAVIVGVGLPQICLENQVLSEVFQDRFDQGFRYAYVYPGITRVLQAAGRVIRSETDRGIVLLIDERWSEREYRSLLPKHWRVKQAANAEKFADAARGFWENGKM